MNSNPGLIKRLIQQQHEFAKKIKICSLKTRLRLIGGADVSFQNQYAIGVIVVLDFDTLEMKEFAWAKIETELPYLPTLLSFRELPPLAAAYKKLKIRPDLILVDGQGIAHPRRIGLASHLGYALNIPTIGCAKSRLVGSHQKLGLKAGARSKLFDRNDMLGYVVRTRNGVRPVFVSPGHRVNFSKSVEVVLHTAKKFRIPEPLRQAHMMSKRLLKSKSNGKY